MAPMNNFFLLLFIALIFSAYVRGNSNFDGPIFGFNYVQKVQSKNSEYRLKFVPYNRYNQTNGIVNVFKKRKLVYHFEQNNVYGCMYLISYSGHTVYSIDRIKAFPENNVIGQENIYSIHIFKNGTLSDSASLSKEFILNYKKMKYLYKSTENLGRYIVVTDKNIYIAYNNKIISGLNNRQIVDDIINIKNHIIIKFVNR